MKYVDIDGVSVVEIYEVHNTRKCVWDSLIREYM